MMTVMIILVLAAFIVTVLSAFAPARAPLWVAVLILCLIALLEHIPLGK